LTILRPPGIELWMYGHLVEASEPYELVANLIDVAAGGQWSAWRFPMVGKPPRLRPQSPGEKIRQITDRSKAAGIPDVAVPFREMRDRDLRNAISHAEYSMHGEQTRILRPYPRSYGYLDLNVVINRAHAFHQAMRILDSAYRASYKEPETIAIHPDCSPDPDEKAVVMVRE